MSSRRDHYATEEALEFDGALGKLYNGAHASWLLGAGGLGSIGYWRI